MLANAPTAATPCAPLRLPPRPQLLISVRDAREAEAALTGGADWIDLKEPARGALGAVDAATAREVVARVAGRAPVSAALGELVDWRGAESRELLGVAGLSHFKLGLGGCRGAGWRDQWLAAQREIAAAGAELVAVLYADDRIAEAPCPLEMLALAARTDCPWVLIDTFDKAAGTIHDYFDEPALRALLSAIRSAGRRTAVAGRLNGPAIERLPLDLVDVVAVRSAACGGDRRAAVCSRRVEALRQLLSSSL